MSSDLRRLRKADLVEIIEAEGWAEAQDLLADASGLVDELRARLVEFGLLPEPGGVELALRGRLEALDLGGEWAPRERLALVLAARLDFGIDGTAGVVREFRSLMAELETAGKVADADDDSGDELDAEVRRLSAV